MPMSGEEERHRAEEAEEERVDAPPDERLARSSGIGRMKSTGSVAVDGGHAGAQRGSEPAGGARAHGDEEIRTGSCA